MGESIGCLSPCSCSALKMQLNTNWGRDVNATLCFCVKWNNFRKSRVSPQDTQLFYKGQETQNKTPCSRLGRTVAMPARKALLTIHIQKEEQSFSQPCLPQVVLYMTGSRSADDLGFESLSERCETQQRNPDYSAWPCFLAHLKDHFISDMNLPWCSLQLYTFISCSTEIPGR